MKNIAKLDKLPAADQKHILDLCAIHTYPEIAAILARPRTEGGLDLQTNRSALNRFYMKNSFLASNSELLADSLQILKAQFGDQPKDLDLIDPLTHLMGQFVFRQFLRDTPFELLKHPLNAYIRLKKLALTTQKMNHNQSPAATVREGGSASQPVTASDQALCRSSARPMEPSESPNTPESHRVPAATGERHGNSPAQTVIQGSLSNGKRREISSLEELDALEEKLKTASPAELAAMANEFLGLEIPGNLTNLTQFPNPNPTPVKNPMPSQGLAL